MLALLSQGALLGLSSSAQPGPFQGYLVARSLHAGFRRSWPIAIVPLLSDPPVIAVLLVLLQRVPETLLTWLGAAGGVVVIWLGVGTLRQTLRVSGTPPVSGTAGSGGDEPRGLVRATLVNLTNPNAWLFWSLVGGPTLTSAWRSSPLEAVAFVAGFYACLVGGNVLLVALAGRAAAAGPRLARTLGLASGAGLVAFGLWQLGRALWRA